MVIGFCGKMINCFSFLIIMDFACNLSLFILE